MNRLPLVAVRTVVLYALTSWLAFDLQAAPVFVPNFSFDSVSPADGSDAFTVANWVAAGGQQVGIENPRGKFTGDSSGSGTLPAPADGATACYLNNGGGTVMLSSADSLGPVVAGKNYTLTVAVGNSLLGTAGTFQIALLVNGVTATTFAPVNVETAITNGTFKDFSTSFTASPAQAGFPLTVQITETNATTGSANSQMFIDNVRVDVEQAPRPLISVTAASPATPAVNQPIVVFSGSGTSRVLTATPVNFHPTSYTWSQVPDLTNRFASTGTATISALQPGSRSVQVSLPAKGIYQFQVTATDEASFTASQYVWVNVWDSSPALQPNHVIGRNPGVSPPTSVTPVSTDPGPYCHPRLFFNRSDWATLNAKDLPPSGPGPVPDASQATAAIQTSLSNHFDKAGDPLNQLAAAFFDYATANHSSDALSNLNSVYATLAASSSNYLERNAFPLGVPIDTNFYNALNAACYLAWIGTDPTLAHDPNSAAGKRFAYLAQVVAGAAYYETYSNLNAVNGNGNNSSGFPSYPHSELALCYDHTFDWMTLQQRQDTRSYLFLISNYYCDQGGGYSRTSPGYAYDGTQQNGGDFPNLADGILLPALAIEGEEMGDSALQELPVTANVLSAASGIGYTPAVPSAATWPDAGAATVLEAQRQVHYYSEFMVTPWGFAFDMMDYFQLGNNVAAPAAHAFARKGAENVWVTTNLYQVFLHAIYNLSPRETDGVPVMFDHHDGFSWLAGANSDIGVILAKYMYPDDPMVDYAYRSFRIECANVVFGNDVIATSMFAVPALDPATWTLSAVAANKGLVQTKLDPIRGAAISRNGWGEKDLNVQLEDRYDAGGHNHGERNTFSLYALGRAWASPPGYHVTISDMQSQVLIQDADLLPTNNSADGYIGTSPASAFQSVQTLTPKGNIALDKTDARYGSPFSGVLLEVTEDPGKQWTWFAGDATSAYNYVLAGDRAIPAPAGSNASDSFVTTDAPTPYRKADRFLPGALANMIPADQQRFLNTYESGTPGFNPVKYAYRSIFTSKGSNPYVIIIDDINKDDTAHNYRWTMSATVAFGNSTGRFVDAHNGDVYSDLAVDSAVSATSTEAVLLHSPIDSGTNAGLPRLLVRDLNGTLPGSNVPGNSPVIQTEDRPKLAGADTDTNLTYGYDNNLHTIGTPVPSRRVFIDRSGVVTPNYKVLLFPYYTGGITPTTSWNSAGTVLTVKIGTQTDTVTFDYNSTTDHRTRIVGFLRRYNNTAAPTLTLPGNLVATASGYDATGAPVANVTFVVTAKDYQAHSLTPSITLPSGSSFPLGTTTVIVSATDTLGQQTTGTFSVTVNPSAPQVFATNLTGNGASGYGVTLNWPYMPGVTGYNVKRSTTPGGPYTASTIIAANLAPAISPQATAYTDSALTNANYYYVVSALLGTTESANSNEVSISIPTTRFTGAGVGLTSGAQASLNKGQAANGSYTTYDLSVNSPTGSNNNISGGSDGASALLCPWTGNGSFTARLLTNNIASTNNAPKMGIAFRASTLGNAPESFVGFQYGGSPTALFFNRQLSGSSQSVNSTFRAFTPAWYRLVRAGNVYSGYYSADGANWTLAAPPVTEVVTAPGVAGVAGLMIAAAGNNSLLTASFDDVVFLATPAATPGNAVVSLDWGQSLGAVSYSVQRSTSATGTFNTIASGLTATNYVDHGVTNLTPYFYTVTASSASGSLTVSPVISTTPAVVPTPANLTATPGNTQVTLNWSAVSGATSYQVLRGNVSGGAFQSYRTGLTATSFTDTGLTNGTPSFYEVTAVSAAGSGVPSPAVSAVPVLWTDQDIGTPAPAGSATYSAGSISLLGGGSDFWSTSDQGNFYSRAWIGDGVWITHVNTLAYTQGYAKAGVMCRASLAANAQNEALVVNPLPPTGNGNGVFFQSRTAPAASTTDTGNTGGAVPLWLKLVRVGSTFTAFTSLDAVTWAQVGSTAATNAFTGTNQVGLPVSSHLSGTLCAATFDQTAFLVTPTALAASNVTPSSVSLSWKPNADGNVQDATATEVDYAPAGTNQWSPAVSTLLPTTTSYVMSGLVPNTAYDFRVRVLAGTIAGDPARLTSVVTAQEVIPVAPASLAGVLGSLTSVQLTWLRSAGATSYLLSVRLTGSTTWTPLSPALPSTASGCLVTELAPGDMYDFRVNAVNDAGTSPDATITVNTTLNYASWQSLYHAGPAAAAGGDGVPNVLKYLTGIDPTTAMTAAERAFLPSFSVDTTTTPGVKYLALTYQQAEGIAATVTLQTSSDLRTWTAVPASQLLSRTLNTSTNASLIELGAAENGSRQQFIRLQVTPQ